MPAGSTILLLRHGEKPSSGRHLSPAGYIRSGHYGAFLPTLAVLQKDDGRQPIGHLFATHWSSGSDRPQQTLEPLGLRSGVEIDTRYINRRHGKHKHKGPGYEKLVHHLVTDSRYERSNIVICWHHRLILDLASLLLGRGDRARSDRWPKTWDDDEYDRVLWIDYAADGTVADHGLLSVGLSD
jgi:hypothetical protein